MGSVAEFLAQAHVQLVCGRFLCIGVADQLAHSKSCRCCPHGERVDGLAPGFEIFDAGKDDLSARKTVELLL